MRDFFAELKRRHVYIVAVFYGVGGWLLVQLADRTFAGAEDAEDLTQAFFAKLL